AMHQTPEAVRAQIQPLLAAFTISCAKTGMLPTREIVLEVAHLFRETDLPSPVVDPVIRSSSGQSLMDEGALETLVAELIPLARLVTPNISEAETRRAAAAIRKLGARAVLIKGGHLSQGDAIDVLDDEGKVTVFREKRI